MRLFRTWFGTQLLARGATGASDATLSARFKARRALIRQDRPFRAIRDSLTYVRTRRAKDLARARLARGLTIDEAAHETKVRPDKIVALESDDYSRFANNAYAKGFLAHLRALPEG